MFKISFFLFKNNDSGPFEIFDKHVKLKKGSQLDYESGKTRYTIQIEFTVKP